MGVGAGACVTGVGEAAGAGGGVVAGCGAAGIGVTGCDGELMGAVGDPGVGVEVGVGVEFELDGGTDVAAAVAGIPLFSTANHLPMTPCPLAWPFFVSPPKW